MWNLLPNSFAISFEAKITKISKVNKENEEAAIDINNEPSISKAKTSIIIKTKGIRPMTHSENWAIT